MKRVSSIAVALASVLIIPTAMAQDVPAQYPYAGFHASRYQVNPDAFGDDFVENVATPGLQAGFRFPASLSIQAWWERNNTRYEESGRKADLNLAMASIRRHFSGISRQYEPYIGFGAGELTVATEQADNDESIMSLEFGVQRRIRTHWIVDVGFRAPHSVDNERWDQQFYIALNHAFGVGAENKQEDDEPPLVTPQPTLRDSDRDGVPDTVDECPGTPRASRVDNRGCRVDGTP